MTIFALPTRDQLVDAAEAALFDGRAAGYPDWDTRERFLQEAATAFDAAAEPPAQPATREDAQP